MAAPEYWLEKIAESWAQHFGSDTPRSLPWGVCH